MDNNNTLPYGAISSSNNSPQHEERHFSSENSTTATNNSGFNPLLIARNADYHTLLEQENHFQQFSSRHSHSASRNSPYRIPHFTHQTHARNGQNVSSLGPNNSDMSLIIDNNIHSRNTQEINSQINSTSTATNRFFHPPWLFGDRTSNDNSRVSGNNLDNRGTPQLPIIREEAVPNAFNTSFDIYRKHRLKRRVSRDDPDDGLPRPASKLLLTEEKMAAKMHSLSISNDHSYHLNGLHTSLPDEKGVSRLPLSLSKDRDHHKEDDNNNMGREDSSMQFVLAPGIKDALANNSQVIPQCLLDQMNKPCMAVIPWIPQDDRMSKISLHLNRTDDQKVLEKSNKDYIHGEQISVGSERVVQTTDAMDDTFEFDDEHDMDL